VTLGWFFIMGRVIVLSLALDAVVYERFGSITTFVFGLPILRSIAKRAPWLRRFFGLDPPSGDSSPPVGPASATLLRDDHAEHQRCTAPTIPEPPRDPREDGASAPGAHDVPAPHDTRRGTMT
jgi:hypothetical protein